MQGEQIGLFQRIKPGGHHAQGLVGFRGLMDGDGQASSVSFELIG